LGSQLPFATVQETVVPTVAKDIAKKKVPISRKGRAYTWF